MGSDHGARHALRMWRWGLGPGAVTSLALLLTTNLIEAAPPASGATPALAPPPAHGPASRMSDAGPAPRVIEAPALREKLDPELVDHPDQPSSSTPPLAVRGVDDAVWTLSQTWESLGGVVEGNPAVAWVTGDPAVPGQALYVDTGVDGNLWVRDDANGWQQLTSGTACTGSPAAVVTTPPGSGGENLLDVACRGADGALWTAASPVSFGALPSQVAMSQFGGLLQGAGVAAAVLGGTAVYFVTGVDSHVWESDPRAPGSWSMIPMQCYGPPSASSDGATATLACLALDDSVQYVTSTATGGAWSTVQSAGGCGEQMLAIRPLQGAAAVDVVGCDDAAWEVQVNSGGVGDWISEGGLIGQTDQSPYQIDVPVIAQTMPLDCETASLQMGLDYLGYDYSQAALFSLENADTRPAEWVDGVLHWGDPFTGFVGDVWGSEANYTGYGVYWPPILAIAESHGAPAAAGGQGYTPLQVYDAVAAGIPVMAWVEYRWVRPPIGTWIAWDGRVITYTTWEHAVIIRGVTPTQVLVNDPDGGSTYWVTRTTFQTSWADFGNMTVILG